MQHNYVFNSSPPIRYQCASGDDLWNHLSSFVRVPCLIWMLLTRIFVFFTILYKKSECIDPEIGWHTISKMADCKRTLSNAILEPPNPGDKWDCSVCGIIQMIIIHIVVRVISINGLHMQSPEPWFNIKMSSYQYRKSHCGDKTILWPSYLHIGISYTGKTSLYWIGALFTSNETRSTLLPIEVTGVARNSTKHSPNGMAGTAIYWCIQVQ